LLVAGWIAPPHARASDDAVVAGLRLARRPWFPWPPAFSRKSRVLS